MVILPGENETQKCVVEGFLKPWQNKKGQNVCCDAPKMQVFSKNCRFLCFSREEELSVMPSKNKLANEKTAGQSWQFWKIHSFLEHPNKCFGSFCFFQGYIQLMYNSKWRKKMLKIGTFYWTLTASFSEWRIFSCSSSTRRSSNLIKTSVDSLSSKVCSRDTSLQSHPAYSIIG